MAYHGFYLHLFRFTICWAYNVSSLQCVCPTVCLRTLFLAYNVLEVQRDWLTTFSAYKCLHTMLLGYNVLACIV